MINFVQFGGPVSIGGQFHSLDYWSAEKHGKDIECTEQGVFIILTVKTTGTRRRVPMTNVMFISDVGPTAHSVVDDSPIKPIRSRQ